MPIDFTCPGCGATTKVADEYMGQTGPCSSCGKMITVPVTGAGAADVRPRKSTSDVLIIVLVVCVISFLGCGLLVALLLPAVWTLK